MSWAAKNSYCLVTNAMALETTRGTALAGWATNRRRVHAAPNSALLAKPVQKLDNGDLAVGSRAITHTETVGVYYEATPSGWPTKSELIQFLIGCLGVTPTAGVMEPEITSGNIIPPMMDYGYLFGQGYFNASVYVSSFGLSWSQSSGKIEFNHTLSTEFAPTATTTPATIPLIMTGDELTSADLTFTGGMPSGCEAKSFSLTITPGAPDVRVCAGGELVLYYSGDFSATYEIVVDADSSLDFNALTLNGSTDAGVALDGLGIMIQNCDCEVNSLGIDGQLQTWSATFTGVDDPSGKRIVRISGAT